MSWKRWTLIGVWVICALLIGTAPGAWGAPSSWALDYSFSLDRNISHVIINGDGSIDVEYWLTYTCDPGAHPIDIVDVGMPKRGYDLSGAQAWFSPGAGDGPETPLTDIRTSEFVDIGVEVHLGEHTIQPGQQGTLHLRVNVPQMVYPDTEDETYASVEFVPHYYDPQYVHGTMYLEVHFYFPPGVTSEETRYHGREYDEVDRVDDRIVFIYADPNASGSQAYRYGVSFPRSYVDLVAKAPIVIGGSGDTGGSGGGGSSVSRLISSIPNCGCPGAFFALVIGLMAFSVVQSRKRKLKYLPPALSVEGVGIKRGLTAVESAILLELPLNRVLTMILFGLLKKRAVTVLEEDPLRLEKVTPVPDKLRDYESGFLESIQDDGKLDEAKLRTAIIELIKSVNAKMKGFSRKETVAYYRSIVDRAWEQISAASSPEVKSRYLDQNLEWMMMDKEFEERTTRTVGTGPIFMPPWWAYYRPWVPVVHTSRVPGTQSAGSQATSSRPSGGRSSSGGGREITLPTLPGAAFASSIVGGMERTSSNIVGRLEQFTGGVTQRTNPVPVSKSSGSSSSFRSGGCACACACACAGCACACAGGGR
jgi:hypothetical protein